MNSVSDVADLLQSLLVHPEPDYTAFRAQVSSIQPQLDLLDRARARIAVRLSLALEAHAVQRAGTADIAVLLRQAIRAYNRRLPLPKSLWRAIQSHEVDSDLRVIEERETVVWIVATSWRPSWLPSAGVEQFDTLAVRRHDQPGVGDGLLYAASEGRFLDYQSTAQKMAVHAAVFAAPGSTTLVTLPTGSGKSLCALLPAWFQTRGGEKSGATTLVVVPTVALALDQEAQARALFHRISDPARLPHSLTGETSAEERTLILQGVRDGTLPLVFTSPESLLQSGLYSACLAAARAGSLTHFVVDEAHLVQTWGANFRTEFQFLATYRRQLLEASGGALRTILLSATIQRSCETLLQRLFSEPGRFTWVGGNRLRPEISFWLATAPDHAERHARIIEALHHLPRPAILYVASPDDALEWCDEARTLGFMRLATFTGDTGGNERRRLLAKWNDDAIDLMIATTAFGLGVDKPDVRAVIHACMPENLDRYYQEVGRGGRDGVSSISLLCVTPNDSDVAESLLSKAFITPDKAIPRWEGMRRSGRRTAGIGDRLRADIDAPPANRPNMRRGPSNRAWNEHTLLLMERAGLIAITDTAATSDPPPTEPSSDAAAHPAPLGREAQQREAQLEIQVLQPLVTDDAAALQRALEPARDAERGELDDALADMRQFVKQATKDHSTRCLAYSLADLYANTALACGGCPACREDAHPPYASPIPAGLDLAASPIETTAPALAYQLQHAFGGQRNLNLLWDGSGDLARFERLSGLLVALVRAGIQQVLAPADLLLHDTWRHALIKRLASLPGSAHALIPSEWILPPQNSSLFPLSTVVVYPVDSDEADRLHRALTRARGDNLREQFLIRIASRDLTLPSEFGLFRDRVTGPVISVNELLTWLNPEQSVGLF